MKKQEQERGPLHADEKVHRSHKPSGKNNSVPSPAPLSQLQKVTGNQGLLRLLEGGVIKPKLRVSQPGDADEIEADREAERVTSENSSEPEPKATIMSSKAHAGGTNLQRKSSTSEIASAPDDLLQSVGPGQALDPTVRQSMESRFGRDFTAVRVHTDEQAAAAARSVRARAFTAGDHVVFDTGEYLPHTASGKQLLTHELTHVTQQAGTSLQPVIHRQPKQQEMPKDIIPGTFTVVKTKRLNGQGAFTGQLLREISTNWTAKSAYGGPDVAQRVVDALESSDSFVQVANALDDFHGKKGKPKFRIYGGFTGTKFVPASTPLQSRASDPVQVVPDENTILIDYTTSVNLYGPAPEQLVAFASSIIHESHHAYDLIKEITKSGLQGHLEEEQRTRKAEIKGLEEIKSASRDKDVQAEVDKRTAQIRQAGLTHREIAEDLVSGGEGTYLESYYIDSAINDFTSREAKLADQLKAANSPVVDLLSPIGTLSDSDLDHYEASVVSTILLFSPIMHKAPGPAGRAMRHVERGFLFQLLGTTMNLKQLTDLNPPHMSDEYKLLYLYLVLVKAYRIKAKVAQAWREYKDDPDPKKKSETIEKNARELLGIPRAYAGIRH